MCRQRDLAHELITAIPGVSCVKPKAALYMFPRLDPKLYPIDGRSGVHRRVAVAGRKCCWCRAAASTGRHPDHFRLVFLPHEDDLRDAIAASRVSSRAIASAHGT
jgi:alanine-synthesizing transaminase